MSGLDTSQTPTNDASLHTSASDHAGESLPLKVVVNQAACTGHARCNATGPSVYDLDEEGYCAVTELLVEPEREAAARAGASACPERAISISR